MQDIAHFVVDNWWLFAALIVVLVLLGMDLMAALVGGVKRLDAAALTRLINDEDCLLLDVRPVEQFNQGHILNSRSLPQSELEQRLESLKEHQQQPVVLVCQTGNLSVAAGRKLQSAGFEQVNLLQGGISAWQTAGLPLIKA